MKISCPACNAVGSIPEHEIPESGRFLNCPRCKEGFTVTKPRSGKDSYLVDTCPACGFSTFGDETFSSCPKCGVEVKAFVERQREEQLLKHNQALLGKKLNNSDTAPPAPEATPSVADFVDNLHPVNLIGWGVAAVAIVVLGIGLWGLVDYDCIKIKEQLIDKGYEQVTDLYVFTHYALPHWLKTAYGVCAIMVSVLFMKRLKTGLRAMSFLLWATIGIVPLAYIISFVFWIMAPVSHTVSGYLIELLNIIFMSALAGVPLYLLERYLHERNITSVVKL